MFFQWEKNPSKQVTLEMQQQKNNLYKRFSCAFLVDVEYFFCLYAQGDYVYKQCYYIKHLHFILEKVHYSWMLSCYFTNHSTGSMAWGDTKLMNK